MTGISKFLKKESGSHLLSHAVSSIVPSAVWVLTVVFGMGTGVSPGRIATGNQWYETFRFTPGFLLSDRAMRRADRLRGFLRKPCIPEQHDKLYSYS